jgi:glycerol kinase
MLAGIGAGLYSDLGAVSKTVTVGTTFEPAMTAADRAGHLSRWKGALGRTLGKS